MQWRGGAAQLAWKLCRFRLIFRRGRNWSSTNRGGSGHLYCAASTIDRMTQLLRPATFDVIAGVRVARIGRHTGFGRVMLLTAADQRSAGTMAGNYSMP
jgi:hypothetical protein